MHFHLVNRYNWQERLMICFFPNSWCGNFNDEDGWLEPLGKVGKPSKVKEQQSKIVHHMETNNAYFINEIYLLIINYKIHYNKLL